MSYLLTVSGLRGIVGEGIDPQIVVRFAASLATLFGRGSYLIGRDTRPHGHIFVNAAASAITAVGGDVVDVGIVPTPTLLFNVRTWDGGARGGIVVTASHNPVEWNALKFVRPDGMFLFEDDVTRLKSIEMVEGWKWAKWNRIGKIEQFGDAIERHVQAVLRSEFVDVDAIKANRFRAAVDAVNGANWFALPYLLEHLGVEVIRLNCEPTGIFPHNPEPKKEHLVELDRLLLNGEADFGFASDPDGDRLLFGFKGQGLLTEEHTLALAAWTVLERKRGAVVANLSTSMMIEDVARHFGVEVARTKVGEANVVDGIIRHEAVIGGEGNGGVILPDVNPTRDSLVGAALILTLAAHGELEKALSSIGSYTLLKTKVKLQGEFDAQKLAEHFDDAEKFDFSDGIYIRFSDAWLHIRPSNTEPVVRIYAEAKDLNAAKKLIERAESALKNLWR